MTKTTIYFQDLKEQAQCRIWQAVQDKLLVQGLIEPRQDDESEDEFKGVSHLCYADLNLTLC